MRKPIVGSKPSANIGSSSAGRGRPWQQLPMQYCATNGDARDVAKSTSGNSRFLGARACRCNKRFVKKRNVSTPVAYAVATLRSRPTDVCVASATLSAPQPDDQAVQHELHGAIAAVDQPQTCAATGELVVDAEARRDDAEAAQRSVGDGKRPRRTVRRTRSAATSKHEAGAGHACGVTASALRNSPGSRQGPWNSGGFQARDIDHEADSARRP